VYTWDHKSSGAFWAGMKVLVLLSVQFCCGWKYFGASTMLFRSGVADGIGTVKL
jgi:hypothetical protein